MEQISSLEFGSAIENAKKLAQSLQGIKPEKFSSLKKEFTENLSEDEMYTLKGLISVLENK